MAFSSRYHGLVSRWKLLVLVIAIDGFACVGEGQIFGPRASVTSLGDGFTLHNPPGIRASVTSLGPQGFTPRPFFSRTPIARPANRPFFHRHQQHFTGGVALPVYAVPYYYSDYPMIVEPTDTSLGENYGPGPTIFDRGGSTASSADLERQYDERLTQLEKQVEEAEASTAPATSPRAEVPEAPERDQPSTVLVFRDGRTAEIRNYAIVGSLLYDFSSGSHRKIDLNDLDLMATERENENRGVDFRVPRSDK